uniref:carbohydrate ABC transporter permease n=1 Tax=Tessaracoccus timonensis TaxID=2161816 RepID=UPI000D55986D|nr:carbohydrate ABC transporter permease [Tessaracoccus timonensis]
MTTATAKRPAKRDDIPPALRPTPSAKTITWIILVFAALYFLLPVVWLVMAATKTNNDLATSFGFWFADFNLARNYESLLSWTGGMFWRWVGNSIFYSLSAATLGCLISVMAGYSVTKFRYPGRRIMMGTISAGLLIPVSILTIPMYTVFHGLGLTDTVWAIIIPCSVLPFGVFLGMVYAEASVPDELLEAARLDGLSEFRIFFTIVLRLLAPAMVTIFLFIFVNTWNNFMLPLMMISKPELKPVTLGLYGMMSYFAPDKGAVMLGALLGVVPLIILFLTLQRYWQAGLAAGAVKG